MSVLMGNQLSRSYWWSLALRGVVAVVFGIIALVRPGWALLALAIFFGAYALIDGITAIYVAIQEGNVPGRWLLLLDGIVGVLFGLLTFFWPAITVLVLFYLVAIWAIITGVMEVIAAFSMRRVISNEWTLALAGVVSILFGIVLFAFPKSGLLALIWLIGIYTIIFGILFLIRAFQFRSRTTPAYSGQ